MMNNNDNNGIIDLVKRIVSVRRQVCPRTSYATAGSASSELVVFTGIFLYI